MGKENTQGSKIKGVFVAECYEVSLLPLGSGATQANFRSITNRLASLAV